jgi:hypothetical protein
MKLLGNTVLQHDKASVNYEILLMDQLLVFKPYFYHLEQDFPCIVLNHLSSGWQLQEKIDKQVEWQIWEDLASLHFTA